MSSLVGQVVETARLILRPFVLADVDEWHRKLRADPEVMRYLPGGIPLPRERTVAVLELFTAHWHVHGYGPWAVTSRQSGELIGQCGLRFIDEIGETEVLYALGRDYWGQGIATEGAAASLRYGFEEVGLDHIIAVAVPANVGSIRVMQKCGMIPEGPTHLFGLDLERYAIAWNDFMAGSEPYAVVHPPG